MPLRVFLVNRWLTGKFLAYFNSTKLNFITVLMAFGREVRLFPFWFELQGGHGEDLLHLLG